MEIITEYSTLSNTRYTYKIADKIPHGYRIWNVNGIEGHPGYCPVCVLYSGTYAVQIDKLVAVPMSENDRKLMLRCSMRTGCGSLKSVQEALASKRTAPNCRELLQQALPLFEKYTET